MGTQVNYNLVEIVKITDLPNLGLSLTNYFAHCGQSGILGKNDLGTLCAFIAPYVSASGVSGLVFPDPSTPNTLPNPAGNETLGSLVGPGTYNGIQADGILNLFGRVNGVWQLITEITIPLTLRPAQQPFKNRFDKNATVHQSYVDVGSGTIQNTTTLEISRSGAINVKDLNNITISGMPINPGYNGYIFQDSEGNLLSKGVIDAAPKTLHVPSGAYVFYFNTQFNVGSNPSFYNTIQVESGISVTDYEPFYSEEIISISGYRIPEVNIVTKSGPSKNRFDKNAIVNDYYIETNTGAYSGPLPATGQIAVSGPIDVSGLSTITLSGLVNAANGGANAYHFVNQSGLILSHGNITTTSITLPVPSGAVVFRFNTKFQNTDLSFYNTLQVESGSVATSYEAYGSSQYVDKINGIPLPVSSSQASNVTPLTGLSMTVEGDSIMEQDVFLSELRAMTGVSTVINAKSGSGYVQNSSGTIRSRASSIAATNPRLILIAGGTNDYGENIPLGTVGVINNDAQFYSAVYNTFRVIREQNQLVPIVVFTPIQRYYHPRSEVRGTLNGLGLSLSQYCDMIKVAAAIFSIPVVDQYSESGITFENIDQATNDGVHVVQYGGRLMARQAAPVLIKNVS